LLFSDGLAEDAAFMGAFQRLKAQFCVVVFGPYTRFGVVLENEALSASERRANNFTNLDKTTSDPPSTVWAAGLLSLSFLWGHVVSGGCSAFG
jgi:hypothetical protein